MTQSYFGTLKRHGVKLSVALFPGYLFHVAMAYLAAFLLIIFAVFIGAVASVLDAEPSEHGKIVLGAVFFLLLFLAGTLPQSFFTAGAYGAAAACVFRGKSTISSFFSEGFRNLWKMFGQQVLLVLFLMVALLLVIFPFGLLVRTEEPPHILIFLFLLILAGYLWVSLHAPLFLVVERTGVWNSILLSFRLIMKKPGQTLLSGLFALAILLGILLLAASILIVLPLLFMNLMEENGAVAALVILGILCFLPVIPYAFAAALLAVVHRYSTRLRHVLFPESHQDGEAAGAAPVPDQ